MAIDNTPPRLKLIVTIAVITVVTLFSLDFVFKSYFHTMSDQAQREKIAPTSVRDDQQKAEQAALTSSNIEQAMASFAKGTRPEAIAPTQSDDISPMTGWSKNPKPAPTRVPLGDALHVDIADAGADASAEGGAGDGGANAATDGGVTPTAADGGAHVVPAPGGPGHDAIDAGAPKH